MSTTLADDYGRLLDRGHLVRRTDDVEGWREAMRRSARMDRLRIRTGVTHADPGVAWAWLMDCPEPDPDVAL